MQVFGPSRASSGAPLEVRGALGAGAMLGHRPAGDYGSSYLLEAHPALRLRDELAAELALSSWSFPGAASTGRATLWGAGLRVDPRVLPRLRLFLDAHAGLGVTGPSKRLMFDGGTGLEYTVNELLSLGLFGRYGQIADRRQDPKFATGGAFLTLSWPNEPAAPVTLRSPPPPLPADGDLGRARSSEPTDGGIRAGDRLPPDGGAPDGMMVGRDAATDGAPG
jgi:hypothetical protein